MSSPLLLSIALGAAVAALPGPFTAREKKAQSAITAQLLAAHTRFLSDDLLEGRAPGSRGDALAMKYVAAEYERLGLSPAGDHGGWLQRFTMVGLKSEVATPPTFQAASGAPLTLHPPEDAIVVSGVEAAAAAVHDAEVVFVGYGIDAPEQHWNDFKDADVRGKVLLVMNNDPENDPALFAGKTRLYYGRWTYKYEEAARKGAAGVIIIHTTPSAGYPWQVVQSSWTGEQFELPAVAGGPRLQVRMWATEDAARRLVALGGHDLDALRERAEQRDFRPVPLGVRCTVALKTELRRVQTANVLGKLEGRDPRLARQVVVVSAHHDHLGVRPGKTGDSIYNGALDNASGVAALLGIAEGMTRAVPRPARTVLFAAVAAEESGLIGSQYFCAHPTVPAGRIAADINIDGMDIWGRTRDVTFVGLGKSTLDAVVQRAAAAQGRVVRGDQFPDRGSFYRSDQFSFARIGVPGVYLDAGTDFIGRPADWGKAQIVAYERTRYHQPSDQLDSTWNFDGAVEDVRLLTAIGLRLADAPAMPRWHRGDEFEAARQRALGAVH